MNQYRLMRVHADDQDTKTLCLFWIIFAVLIIVIAIIGKFARRYELI